MVPRAICASQHESVISLKLNLFQCAVIVKLNLTQSIVELNVNLYLFGSSISLQGAILENNPAEGIVVANQSLVLQNASRARTGIYTCVGSNREGDGESNPVQLDIRCE